MLEKENKSKLQSIKYKELETQEYLLSSEINVRKKKLLFKIRTRMLYTMDNLGIEASCKLCKLEKDSIDHILQCIILKLQVPEILNYGDTRTSDVFGDDISRMSNLVNIFEKAWRKRLILLE